MKKMMFILMIMTALLASTVFADAPADITNPGFEDDTIAAGAPDYWTLAGGPNTGLVYHQDEAADAHSGTDFMEVKEDGGWAVIHTNLGEEVDISGLAQAEMLVWARSKDGSSIVNGVALKFEFYQAQGQGWNGAEGPTPFTELNCDVTGTYQLFSLVSDVPAGINYARATVVARANAGVYVDDVWIGEPGTYTGGGVTNATLPAPKNGSIQSVLNTYGYTAVTDLSWTNPAPIVETDALGVEVKFGVGVADPNFPGASVASGSDLETVALSALSPAVTLPLADDTSYYWQVIITDPNTGGSPVVTEGNIWTFTVGDALPIIEAPVGAYMWVDQEDGDGNPAARRYTVTSTYTDDGKSEIVGEPNFVTGDWLWDNGQAGVRLVSLSHVADLDGSLGEQSGTVTEVYETVALGGDALRPTEETAIPSWQSFGILVVDAVDRETTGPTGFYYIGEDCGDATNAEGAGDAGGDPAFAESFGVFDVNFDCIINLVDFSDLAAVWLDVSPKKE